VEAPLITWPLKMFILYIKLTQSQNILTKVLKLVEFGYCYHLVNVISLTLQKIDHLKQLSLSIFFYCYNVKSRKKAWLNVYLLFKANLQWALIFKKFKFGPFLSSFFNFTSVWCPFVHDEGCEWNWLPQRSDRAILLETKPWNLHLTWNWVLSELK
jgi:hypothetical protein